MHSTKSMWLKHENKFCFLGHRRYLPMDHLWRQNKRTFDGNQELKCASIVQSGDEILIQLEGMVLGDENTGKKTTKKWKKGEATTDSMVWKKNFFFFFFF
jgi:hypothetical protein